MIGTPLCAKDWDRELRTTAGEAIVRVLMPFHEMPLQLDRPETHLEKEVPASLLVLGLAQAKANVVSREAYMAAVNALPQHCRRGAAMGLVVGLAESLSRPLVDLLDKHVERAPSYDNVFRLLHASLFDAFIGRMDRDFGRLSNTGTRLGLQQSLCSQVAALADGRPDLAAKAQPYTFLYRAGNWPLGIMKDGDFLVLVR